MDFDDKFIRQTTKRFYKQQQAPTFLISNTRVQSTTSTQLAALHENSSMQCWW